MLRKMIKRRKNKIRKKAEYVPSDKKFMLNMWRRDNGQKTVSDDIKL